MTTQQESFTLYEYKKLGRVSHEELLCPLIYWSNSPQHDITAICVHKSLQFGEIMITGSNHGEFVIWKSISILNAEEDDDEEEDDDLNAVDYDEDDSKANQANKYAIDANIEWMAMAMTLSTNTTPITCIVGLTTYHEQTAFAATHLDGELVIFSVSGSGALKICRSERAIIHNTAVANIYGHKLVNDSYQYLLATDFYHDHLHLIELHKGKQVRQYSVSESIDDVYQSDDDNLCKIVDVAFFHEPQSATFVCIDIAGKMGVFEIDDTLDLKAVHGMEFNSRLRNVPIAVDVAFDNEYIVAITRNEFAVYCMHPSLSRIASKTEKNVEWSGMLVFDKYINYTMLPDYNDSDQKTDDSSTTNALDEYVVKRPFFVLLWGSGASQITLYLISKETAQILTAVVELNVVCTNNTKWNVLTHDDQHIYVGLENGQILSYSIERLKELAIKSYTTLWRNSFRVMNLQFVQKVDSNILADIAYSFTIQTKAKHMDLVNNMLEQPDFNRLNTTALMLNDIRMNAQLLADVELVAESDDIHMDDDMKHEEADIHDTVREDDGDEIVCSCMNITSYGVLLCSGYRSGEVYVYNLTECEAVLEIHTRLSCVTSLWLLCVNYKEHINDGILFIGYQDGYVEVVNCDTGTVIFSKRCHYGMVRNLVQFEQDYYVFSIGEDNAICSFLVLSELVTMKSILEQIRMTDNEADSDSNEHEEAYVRWNYYRGHSAKIVNLYRNAWCLKNDYIAVELETQEIVIWCVGTAQIERQFVDRIEAKRFRIDQSFDMIKRRNDVINAYKPQLYNIYNISRNSSHLNVNGVILDIAAIFQHPHSSQKDANNNGNNVQSPKHTAEHHDAVQYRVQDILRVMSLLLDWEIHSKSFNDDFLDTFNRYLYTINHQQQQAQFQPFREIRKSNNSGNGNADDLYNLLLVQDIKPCFGFIGDYQSITMLFPICSRNGGKWKMHSKFTSVYMLAINTLCIWLRKQIQIHAQHGINNAALPSPVSPIGSPGTPNHVDMSENHEMWLEFVNKELITFYSVLLPENLNGFIEPSRNTISRCCLSSTSALRKTSRLLLESMVKRMEINAKHRTILKWKTKFTKASPSKSAKTPKTAARTAKTPNGAIQLHSFSEADDEKKSSSTNEESFFLNSSKTDTMSTSSIDIADGYTFDGSRKIPLSVLFNGIIICIIHIQQQQHKKKHKENKQQPQSQLVTIEESVSSSVIQILIAALKEAVHHKSDEIKKSLACYYLGRVITSWSCDTNLFCNLLNILLDLCSDYDDVKNKNGNILSESAMYALIECGKCSPHIFIKVMGAQALQISKRGRHSKALLCLERLIYTEPLTLLKYIPFTIRTIIKCLDPSSPQKRKALLESTTRTLHALVHQFPNCSFHSKTQHFAICINNYVEEENAKESNNNNNSNNHMCGIVIYDLRTATQFGKVLKQHKAIITAIEFNHDGKYLVSYSAYEKPKPVLCCWKLNTNEGVLGFFGSQSKCIKLIELEALSVALKPSQHIENTQLTWDPVQRNQVRLQREDKSVETYVVF